MTSWIIRILLVLILLRLVWRFAARVWQSLAGPAGARPSTAALVRDPVCGTYVLPSRAVALQWGADTKYFCSDQCRKTWQRRSA